VTTDSSVTVGRDDDSALPAASDLLRDLPSQVVSVGDLMDTFSPRERLEDPAHIQVLAEAESTHPLLVHRPTMRVIDGVHRLRAAMIKGRTEVTVQTFDGSEADAFVLAVELNVRHGLPLTLRERRAAAQRIISSHPHWSDRAIADRTGLSAKTVGRARRQANGQVGESDWRIGRDGRARPVNCTEARRAVAAMIAAEPRLSLRELARRAGVSVSTVRDVRQRLDRGQDPVPERLRDTERLDRRPGAPPCIRTVPARAAGAATVPPVRAGCAGPRPRDTTSTVQTLLRDPSLRATESGRRLLRLLMATELERSALAEIAEAVPAHCAALVRAVALRRAEDWRQLADQMAAKPANYR
jgi:uncharacterized protein YerC